MLKGIKLITNISERMGNNKAVNNKFFINNKPNFKSDNIEAREKSKDIYAQMPIRALGYTNELGEAIRPLSPLLANLSWLPAIAYISADVADKYRQDEYSNKKPSKGRASKELSTQLLASVFLPTCAVKLGQSVVNNLSSFGKSGLNFNQRENVSDVIINSMKAGEHKNFTGIDGKIDAEAYKKSLANQFDEILKHKKTGKKLMKPIELVLDFVKKPFIKKASTENIKNYAGKVVDRLIDERQQLLDGKKPKIMSEKMFKKYSEITKDMAISEKQGVTFNTIKKLEGKRMFNNRILKSAGGLLALAVMAKPIDKFVEKVVVDKYVGPQIDNVSAIYYRQLEEQRLRKAGKDIAVKEQNIVPDYMNIVDIDENV